MLENVHELRAHGGPSWLRWRRAMAASVGGILVDDVRDEA